MAELSAQAIALHVQALMAAVVIRSEGYLASTEAERIACDCGALVDELVEAGLWLRRDIGYRVLAGSLGRYAVFG
jgi:hypothetical protein